MSASAVPTPRVAKQSDEFCSAMRLSMSYPFYKHHASRKYVSRGYSQRIAVLGADSLYVTGSKSSNAVRWPRSSIHTIVSGCTPAFAANPNASGVDPLCCATLVFSNTKELHMRFEDTRRRDLAVSDVRGFLAAAFPPPPPPLPQCLPGGIGAGPAASMASASVSASASDSASAPPASLQEEYIMVAHPASSGEKLPPVRSFRMYPRLHSANAAQDEMEASMISAGGVPCNLSERSLSSRGEDSDGELGELETDTDVDHGPGASSPAAATVAAAAPTAPPMAEAAAVTATVRPNSPASASIKKVTFSDSDAEEDDLVARVDTLEWKQQALHKLVTASSASTSRAAVDAAQAASTAMEPLRAEAALLRSQVALLEKQIDLLSKASIHLERSLAEQRAASTAAIEQVRSEFRDSNMRMEQAAQEARAHSKQLQQQLNDAQAHLLMQKHTLDAERMARARKMATLTASAAAAASASSSLAVSADPAGASSRDLAALRQEMLLQLEEERAARGELDTRFQAVKGAAGQLVNDVKSLQTQVQQVKEEAESTHGVSRERMLEVHASVTDLRTGLAGEKHSHALLAGKLELLKGAIDALQKHPAITHISLKRIRDYDVLHMPNLSTWDLWAAGAVYSQHDCLAGSNWFDPATGVSTGHVYASTQLSLQGRLNQVAPRVDADHQALASVTRVEKAEVNLAGTHFTNWSAEYGSANYSKDALGRVVVQGLLKRAPQAPPMTGQHTVMFTLPAGFRPKHRLVFSQVNSEKSEAYRIDVLANGQVMLCYNKVLSWYSLAGITFMAA